MGLVMTDKLDKKLDKFVPKVLDRMFRKVGFKKFDKEFIELYKDDWYTRRTWTNDQEEEFHKYFVKTAIKDLGVPKKWAEEQFGWFNLNYGWKLKE